MEADGRTILDASSSGKLFGIWTHEGRFDWELGFKLTSKSMLPNTFELIVWLNRLYYLLPLAQKFSAETHGQKGSVLFKDSSIGANSFRTSHYPYSEEIMELADREGTAVIDEAPAVRIHFFYTNEKVFRHVFVINMFLCLLWKLYLSMQIFKNKIIV